MCHVLIIEDEMVAAFDIQGALRPAGATSFSFAETENEAVAQARARRPDVIVSDYMLADGSGPEAVRSIRAEHGAIPVIFVTAIPDQLDESELMVVEKPFGPARLSALFRSVAPG